MIKRRQRSHAECTGVSTFLILISGLVILSVFGCSTTNRLRPRQAIILATIAKRTPPFESAESIGTTPSPPIASKLPEKIASPSPTFLPTQTPDNRVDNLVAEMSLAELVGQTMIVGINGTTLTSQTCGLISQLELGGIFYRSGNAISPWQLREFSLGIQSCAKRAAIEGGMLIAIDHEGQYIYRFNEGATRFPMQMAIGATGDVANAFRTAYASGQELDFAGINMIFGPVLDILSNPDNSVISTRAFGGYPEQVSSYSIAAILGYLEAGILPAAKHFPGHGSVSVDSHVNLPVDQSNYKTIYQNHLPAFQMAIAYKVPSIMIGHVAYPSLDESGLPASLSERIIQNLLKTELGFNGIVMTDALGMGAINQGKSMSVEDAAVEAIKAGVDIVLIPSSSQAISVHSRIMEAINVGELSIGRVRDAAHRVLQVKIENNLADREHIVDVDWEAHRVASMEIGRDAVAVVVNNSYLIPLRDEWQDILLICPHIYSEIANTIRSTNRSVNFIGYSLPIWDGVPEGHILRSLPAQGEGYDGVIVCTYDAHLLPSLYGDYSQIELVRGLIERRIPTIVVALKSPFDLLDFTGVDAYIASFGTTPGQISAVANILVGKQIPSGSMPVELDY